MKEYFIVCITIFSWSTTHTLINKNYLVKINNTTINLYEKFYACIKKKYQYSQKIVKQKNCKTKSKIISTRLCNQPNKKKIVSQRLLIMQQLKQMFENCIKHKKLFFFFDLETVYKWKQEEFINTLHPFLRMINVQLINTNHYHQYLHDIDSYFKYHKNNLQTYIAVDSCIRKFKQHLETIKQDTPNQIIDLVLQDEKIDQQFIPSIKNLFDTTLHGTQCPYRIIIGNTILMESLPKQVTYHQTHKKQIHKIKFLTAIISLLLSIYIWQQRMHTPILMSTIASMLPLLMFYKLYYSKNIS